MKLKTEVQMQKNKVLKDGPFESTKEMLYRVAKIYPNNKILAELDENKNIVYHTSVDVLTDVEAVGESLLELGLKDKHIAILAENSYLYIICDLAISGGVGVITPIDKDAPEEMLTKLLNSCDADCIICSSYLIKKLENIKNNINNVKTIITIDKKVENYLFLHDLMQKGYELRKHERYKNNELDLDKPVKLLFTSGTTGANKGVLLNQKNLAANFVNCLDVIRGEDNEKNTSMSILPMHHATEINTHITARIACGRLTYINGSMKDMMSNIKIFKPYVITIVPMIANAFYKQIWVNAEKLGKKDKLKKGIKLAKFLRLFNIDITHKLFKEIYAPFGGNLNQIVCGGAMLNPEVVKGFNDLGIKMFNGYGITECGPLVSMNNNTLKEIYSVGKKCPKSEIKLCNIDENNVGELCVKGKSVALGYYKDENATNQVFDSEGYFHTGDLAKIDKKGNIFLVGRKKNVIILDNGKNVCPEEIEHEIELNIDYIKEVVVYQKDTNENQLIVAGIYIEDENIRNDTERIKEDFRNLNKLLPNYKRVNYVNLVDSEYEKTSTRKIKRDAVLLRHNDNGIRI